MSKKLNQVSDELRETDFMPTYNSIVDKLPHRTGLGNYKGVATLTQELGNQICEFDPETWEECHNIIYGLKQIIKTLDAQANIWQNEQKQ